MNNILTIHLIQWRIVPGEVKRNLDRAEELIGSASPGKGDLVLLPEMFPSGFFYTDLGKMAEEYEAVVRWMGAIGARYEVGVAGSVPFKKPEGVANTMVLVDKSGEVVASYDKIHLFHVADEDTRKLCDDGARIVLVSAQWPRARVDHFRDLTRVRAMENQMFVVSCNSCGDDDKGLVLGGGSTVVGPSGEVKGVLGDDEGVLTVTLALDEVEETRENFPVLKVRRKDLWK